MDVVNHRHYIHLLLSHFFGNNRLLPDLRYAVNNISLDAGHEVFALVLKDLLLFLLLHKRFHDLPNMPMALSAC